MLRGEAKHNFFIFFILETSMQEEFEDIKGVIRICKSKKDR